MKFSKFPDFLFFKCSIYLSIYVDKGVFLISMFGLVSTRMRPCLHIVKITEARFQPNHLPAR